MKRTNEIFIITITGEIEEMIYENAITLLPDYQKNIYFESHPKYDTNKSTYQGITKIGEELVKKMESDEDFTLYSQVTCAYKSEFYIFDATLNIFELYCNFKCFHHLFGGKIDYNDKSIFVSFNYNHQLMSSEYEITYKWFKKYNLNNVTLTSLEQCRRIFYNI